MVRDDHVCRRSFFAAGGATALLQLLHPNADPGLRAKAATLAADLVRPVFAREAPRVLTQASRARA